MFGYRLEQEILDALADGTPSYVVDLAATIDEHPVAVEHACDRLHEDGSVRSIGCQRYAITASGRHQIAGTNPLPVESETPTETEGRT